MPKGQGMRNPASPSRWSRRLSDTPAPSMSGAMLVLVVDKNGTFNELYCDHPLLSGFSGKQRPFAKFLTKSLVRKLLQCIPVGKYTTYNKMHDRKLYRHTAEPEDGDLEADEFCLDPFRDGRRFANALLLDFVSEFGRKAETGDNTTSSATIFDFL